MTKLLRAALAATMALAITLTGGAAANADNTGTEGYGVRIVEAGGSVQGTVTGVNRHSFGTALMAIVDKSGHEIAKTYCIDIRVATSNDPDLGYVETDPSKLPGGISMTHQIRWILANSYPVKSIEQVKTAAQLSNLTSHDAITATQAAIWTYANGFKVEGIASGAKGLYEWLIAGAEIAPNTPDPGPVTLSIKGANTVENGVLGPLTISGNTKTVQLVSISGGTLIDAAGKAIDTTAIPVGTPLFVKVEGQSGSVELRVKGTITVTSGRAFVAIKRVSQTLVTASEVVREDNAGIKIDWKAPSKLTVPTVATVVSSQTAEVGATISDTIEVSNIVKTLDGAPVTHKLEGKLYGPVAPLESAGALTCEGVEWTKAPVASTFTVKEFNDLIPVDGKIKIEGVAPYTVKEAGCYSYAETLTSTVGKQTVVVDHTVGKPSQTSLVKTAPKPTPTPTPVKDTPTPTPTPVKDTPTPSSTPTTPVSETPKQGPRPLADTGC